MDGNTNIMDGTSCLFVNSRVNITVFGLFAWPGSHLSRLSVLSRGSQYRVEGLNPPACFPVSEVLEADFMAKHRCFCDIISQHRFCFLFFLAGADLAGMTASGILETSESHVQNMPEEKAPQIWKSFKFNKTCTQWNQRAPQDAVHQRSGYEVQH